ncbi:TY-Chap2 family putative peptide chaperone [Aeromicrobium wangtongii]|uniref:T3SS peptide-binding chaperone domain-containing protein n=1 Tax=Aeromicrobium wangtongii TaxID=2969247 RepID=A0ABY5M2D2_9ACTN|nr:hypothetical protein [Aeromicrobium wangtongii]MCD9198318.1 hypothetical protein [Aeromicrobium wangtongii]UUP12350.1 hypothetical protein NQV15_10835 [Aeromicrobium wangtongii]
MSGEFEEHVREAMAWRLIAELVRRHPGQLWVRTEKHSVGSEQAFLINLQDPSSAPLGIIGLPGSTARSWVGGAEADMSWREAYEGGRDPRDWLIRFEQMIGLESTVGGLPASTPSSLALRLVGQFLVSSIGARDAWIAGGPRRWKGSDRLIPAGARWTGDDARPYPIEPLFIGQRDEHRPVAALSPSGHMWTADKAFDLQNEYLEAGSINALLLRTMPRWMN